MKLRFIFFYTLRNLSRVLFGRNFLFRNNIAKNLYLSFASIVHFFSLDHRKQAKWEIENPDAPWLVPKAVVFIENWLKKEMKGFEFGSGRSTKTISPSAACAKSVMPTVAMLPSTLQYS